MHRQCNSFRYFICARTTAYAFIKKPIITYMISVFQSLSNVGCGDCKHSADTLRFAWSQKPIRDFLAKLVKNFSNGDASSAKCGSACRSAGKKTKRAAYCGAT